MRYDALIREATDYLLTHPMNRIRAEDAIREDLIGMPLYDAPIFAVGSANDPLFSAMRDPSAVHPDYLLPVDWLPGAKCVISFFAPYTERIRRANAQSTRLPADEWLHARYEGEELLALFRMHVRDLLLDAGHRAVAPLHDARFAMLDRYASNWSERHTGYICGLGTFGMSRGLITKKGMAGRLGSVVTDYLFPITGRTYDSLYGYCTRCGKCASHCPVHAINPSGYVGQAKSHPPCDAFLAHTRSQPARGQSAKQRYGCGKCQVNVPCEFCIPK